MRFSNYGLSGAIGSSMSLAAMANGGGGVLKRRALVLKNDPEGSGKYIAGLHEIRVRTRDEALAVFRTGQRARQVFGTMANRESSRSHGIFTLKVVRIHNGAPEDPDSAQVSRLSIVDLAGSERTRNTHNTGDRLKEAGNINKSLMVLGQCLEVLRANQQKVAAPAPPGLKKKLAVVPFRHSKLTEIFQNFFVGDGRAVMVVHVNPYDTGFDENSHVMRFSAVAREIQTTANLTKTTTSLKRQISTQFNAVKHAFGGGQKIKVVVPVMRPPSTTPYARQSTMPPPPVPPKAASRSVRPPTPAQPEPGPEVEEFVEEEIEVVEEDVEEDEDDDEKDALVDYLFEQLADLKTQLYESEMRNATLEVEIREEVSHEVQETIQRMQAEFQRRIQLQAISGEEKADMKLDILQRTMGHVQSDVDTSFDQSFASADETLVSWCCPAWSNSCRTLTAATQRDSRTPSPWRRPAASLTTSRSSRLTSRLSCLRLLTRTTTLWPSLLPTTRLFTLARSTRLCPPRRSLTLRSMWTRRMRRRKMMRLRARMTAKSWRKTTRARSSRKTARRRTKRRKRRRWPTRHSPHPLCPLPRRLRSPPAAAQPRARLRSWRLLASRLRRACRSSHPRRLR